MIIINETILKEKFEESDTIAYDYLIDNAETDEQVELLQELQSYPEANVDNNKIAYTQDDKDFIQYSNRQSQILMSLGIDINKLLS